MVPVPCPSTAPVPPPSYHRARAKQPAALHLTVLALATTLPLSALCQWAVEAAHPRCPPPLPQGPGGALRRDASVSLLWIALLRTPWRLSDPEMPDWLCAWPARALVPVQAAR